MFLVWVGTIITALLTIDPNLFGRYGENQRLFNGLITVLFSPSCLPISVAVAG